MKLCLISEGGFGDFLLHLDAIRQLISQEDNVEVFVCASEPKTKVGELISDFVQEWAILNSHSAKKLISTSDVLIEHRWFARINRPSLLPSTDLSLYNLFDLGRRQGAAALRHYFDQGMTLRDIIVKSLGVQPDENLFSYNKCQDVISQRVGISYP